MFAGLNPFADLLFAIQDWVFSLGNDFSAVDHFFGLAFTLALVFFIKNLLALITIPGLFLLIGSASFDSGVRFALSLFTSIIPRLIIAIIISAFVISFGFICSLLFWLVKSFLLFLISFLFQLGISLLLVVLFVIGRLCLILGMLGVRERLLIIGIWHRIVRIGGIKVGSVRWLLIILMTHCIVFEVLGIVLGIELRWGILLIGEIRRMLRVLIASWMSRAVLAMLLIVMLRLSAIVVAHIINQYTSFIAK